MLNDFQNKKFKEDGIIKIENLLSESEIINFKKLISYYSAEKNTKNSFWPTNNYLLMLKLLKLDFKRFKDSLKILKFEKEKNLKRFAQAAFDSKKVFLNFIDAYVSKKSKQNIIPWHTDQAYHGNLNPENFVNHEKFFLKIFIYLTDVSSKNGCMSYIPGSHKIGFAIRKGIFEKKIGYQPYWNLIDLRNLVIKNKEYLSNFFGGNFFLVEEFLKKSDFIINNSDTDLYDYSIKAGGAIIFDEGGSHRGSSPTLNDRIVLRYLFSKFKN
tara:strand:- start:2300 stop:3106 length:807 start_codon:yes stop_codon:yes gene_type:complete